MDYKNFKSCIDKIKQCEKELLAFDKLNIDISETKHVDVVGYLADMLFMEAFGADGLDRINWWLYEDVDHTVISKDGINRYACKAGTYQDETGKAERRSQQAQLGIRQQTAAFAV